LGNKNKGKKGGDNHIYVAKRQIKVAVLNDNWELGRDFRVTAQ